MLITNADDFGRNSMTTENIIACHNLRRITSASIMLFMRDSSRAATKAVANCLPTGLHLNLDLPFDSPATPVHLKACQERLIKYFRLSYFARFVYNPFLRNDFDYVFKAQYEGYLSIFGQEPAQIDGHHHHHLCMNILIDRIMPNGSCIRRNFTFDRGEKSFLNRLFRRFIDSRLSIRYRIADALFSIEPLNDIHRLARIVRRAYSTDVELIVHPGVPEQYSFLMSQEFGDLIEKVPKGSYRTLKKNES